MVPFDNPAEFTEWMLRFMADSLRAGWDNEQGGFHPDFCMIVRKDGIAYRFEVSGVEGPHNLGAVNGTH